ncbi:MAG: hypothetical protein IT352_14085 [Gemmatimonadales bacterium]|nr:hypothetical protein [Gemmatimonadales bacterium]
MDSQLPSAPVGFDKVLSSHGYGFQYAILDKARALYESRASRWVFEVAEFPVAAIPASTRLDFMLRHRDNQARLIAECKRANPALAHWCFAKAPYRVRNTGHAEPLVLERCRPFQGEVRAEAQTIRYETNVFHLGFELRAPTKGDAAHSGRGAIEDALTQVLRGMNGFTGFLAARPALVPEESAICLLPVIFTTASLWTTDAPLEHTDLATGTVPATAGELTPSQWLFYQYHQSPDLAHSVPGNRVDVDLSRILEVDLTRTVAIVSPSGIEHFLWWSSEGLW